MISNGFNIEKVKGALKGRLGWLPSTISGIPTLSDANKLSNSGRYYNDGSFHASVSLQKLYDVQENAQITEANFNVLLQTLEEAAIFRCLNAVFNRPQLIERKLVYERVSNVRNIAIPNGHNFCGYRIKVAAGNFAVTINTISLFFNGASTFNIYLFNDLRLEPLQTKEVTTVANDQVNVTLDWQLNYAETTNKGGIFYIGYFQDDVLSHVQAMDEQLNLWADSKVFGAYPFQSPKTANLNFNRINPSVVYRTYGLNLEISSFRDYTEAIVQNANIFDEARGLTMAVLILDMIKNSTRTNSVQRQSLSSAQLAEMRLDTDLDQPTKDLPFVSGLKKQIMREFERINLTFFPKAVATSMPIGNGYDAFALGYDTFDIKNLPPREQFY
jgi:hypothetical protein